ncbi:hypothetical protein FQN57_006950 [Myotisia sp. PD_48]|nr:hypothetical protein FQN57_006950 [Myotisia sp. PD_48]
MFNVVDQPKLGGLNTLLYKAILPHLQWHYDDHARPEPFFSISERVYLISDAVPHITNTDTMRYTYEQLLNLTVEDIRDIKFIEVEKWEDLPEEQQNKCISFLRELLEQRDGITQSQPVDALELQQKLEDISSMLQMPPRVMTPPPDGPEDLEHDLDREKEAYKTLLAQGGIPSHPIELGFGVLECAGGYKDIISYWDQEHKADRLLFTTQLNEWNKFQSFQQKIRQYHLARDSFPIHQQRIHDRRVRHGLHGTPSIHHDKDQQSKLDTWMEYQDYHYQVLEKVQTQLDKAQANMTNLMQQMKSARLPVFQDAEDLATFFSEEADKDFGVFYGLAIEQGKKESSAVENTISVKKALKIAEDRYKIAQSEELGDIIKKSSWVKLAESRVDSIQEHLAEIRVSQGGRAPTEWDYDVRYNYYLVEKELKNAQYILESSQSDFEETVEKTTLLELINEEVRKAKLLFEDSKQVERLVDLQGDALSELGQLAKLRRRVRRIKILLEWIEKQRLSMISSETSVPAKVDTTSGSTRELRSSTLRLNKSVQKNTPKQHSPLRPQKPQKVSKCKPKQAKVGRRALRDSWDSSSSRRSFSITKVLCVDNDNMSKFARRISSRTSNFRTTPGCRSILMVRTSNQPVYRNQPTSSIVGVMDKLRRTRSAGISKKEAPMKLRRSTRITRQPDWFRPS